MITMYGEIVWVSEWQANDGCYHREVSENYPEHPDFLDLNGKRYYFFRFLPRRKNESGEFEFFYPWMG